MSETQFQVGDFVVFDHNVDGPIYEVERLDEMFIVIRDENDDLQSVDPATLTLYGRRGLLTESLGSVARKSARIAELEQANAALRLELAERTRQRDEVCKDPRLQLKWGVFVGGKIVIGCVLESRAAQLAALGRQDTPADSGEFTVRDVVAEWQRRTTKTAREVAE